MISSLHVIGLTGGIASGKSTVSRVLRRCGIPVLDAAGLGHMVLEAGHPARDAVIDAFGRDILCADGVTIDRRRLGHKVFDSPAERARLEAITHPAIAALAKQGLALIADRGERLAVYEAALLVETGIHRHLEGLIVVSTSLENQLERLRLRDGLSAKDAATRIACQLPLAEKLNVADWVLENNGDPADLENRAQELATLLRTKFT